MPLTGNYAGLDALMRNLEKLSSVPSQVATEASKDITESIQKQFSSGVDPYGKGWAPLKPATLKTGRTPPPLDATGKMKSGTKAYPMQGAGIAIELPFPGIFHQAGTSKMVARKVLPEKTFPKEWSAAIRKAATKSIRKAMGK